MPMKPTLLRLDEALSARIEAFRVERGLKASSEAMRQLMRIGLAASAPGSKVVQGLSDAVAAERGNGPPLRTRTVGPVKRPKPSLVSVPVGPQPFKPRLKDR